MSSTDVLIALVCITVAVVVGVQLLRSARDSQVRRARKRRYRQAGHVTRPQQLADDSPEQFGGMTPVRAHAIRREAEQAARRAGNRDGAEPPNPYARGTQEFVLWVASYHLAMADIDDERAGHGTGLPSPHL